jgi:hypothetical protein
MARATDAAAQDIQTPLELMLALMRDVTKPLSLRIDMAQAAAPYVHPKLRSTDKTETPSGHEKSDHEKSPEEHRAELIQLLIDFGMGDALVEELARRREGASGGAAGPEDDLKKERSARRMMSTHRANRDAG